MPRSFALLAAIAFLVLAACGGGTGDSVVSAPTTPPSPEATGAPPTEATTDAPSARAVVDTPIDVTGADSIVVDSDEVWVGSLDGNWVRRFDAATGAEVAALTDVCGRNAGPSVAAITGDRVWVECGGGNVRSTLLAVDRAGGNVAGTVDIGFGVGSIVPVGGTLWVAVAGEGVVAQIDAASLAASGRTPVGTGCDRPTRAQSAGGSLWVIGPTVESCATGVPTIYRQSRVHEIDAASLEVVWSSPLIPGARTAMAVTGGEIWTTGEGDVLNVLDATSKRVVDEVGPDLGRGPGNAGPLLAAGDRFVWVLNRAWDADPAEIVIVDRAARSVVERIELDDPTAMWIDDDAAWVTYRDGVARISEASSAPSPAETQNAAALVDEAEDDALLVGRFWSDYADAWADGIESGLDFIAEHNHPDLDFSRDDLDCAYAGIAPGYREAAAADLSTLRRSDNWVLPPSPVSPSPIDGRVPRGRLYTLGVEYTFSVPGAEPSVVAAEPHVAVLAGSDGTDRVWMFFAPGC